MFTFGSSHGQGHVSGIMLHYTQRAGWSNGNTRIRDREERGTAEVFIVSLINLVGEYLEDTSKGP
jgi:hypothetical protein